MLKAGLRNLPQPFGSPGAQEGVGARGPRDQAPRPGAWRRPARRMADGQGSHLLLKLAESSLHAEDVHFGTHLQVWGSWYDKEQGAWGYGCCKSTRRKRARCPKTAPAGEAPQDEDDEDEFEVRCSQRMADLLETNPAFAGDVPTPAQYKGWTTAELRNFIYSNGLIRPARKGGAQKAPPTKEDWKILELEEGAEAAVIKKQYRRLALVNHPDKHQGEKAKAKASEKFQRLAQAYEAICGHVAEVPAMPAEAMKKRKWRIVVVDDNDGEGA